MSAGRETIIRARALRGNILLLAAGGALLVAYGVGTRHGPALADEFIYLAGARHLAWSFSLDARYYDASAILARGHPHHDVHAPGYALLLGAVSSLAGASYASAVALNVVAYLASALLVARLATALGASSLQARLAGLLMLLLPGALPYVFWVMAESVLTALVLGALVLAATSEDRLPRAVAAGGVLGLAFLVRESAVFVLPALLSLVRGRARRGCVAAFAAMLLLVSAPLSVGRAPGGANFWAPSSGTAFGFGAVQAARAGRLVAAGTLFLERAARNTRELAAPTTTWTERGILLTFVALPILAAVRWRSHSPSARRFLGWLLAAYAVVVVLLFAVYVVGQWSGYRYAIFLMPAFLALAVPMGRAGSWLTAALAAWGLVLTLSIRTIFNDYKASRQKRQAGIADYVERFVPGAPQRVALINGWLYGWRHYPTEVISSLPPGGGALRALERAVWFDVLVIPAGTELHRETEGRLKYQRLNHDPDPPLVILRRLR